ncbi:NAD(P)-dependent alcohol dehydrogenase [Actinomadura sp. DC4]|uniref:NAD(P)-dependent alcohol dehydrogenase n=1 Tax=Actinomadura sp. DC4 TaxID=3055069 RepID=UPI0025AECFD2|nr:NAD(P)-dependent alcohol dehydrogenase [Actinomadura sp. DC4]
MRAVTYDTYGSADVLRLERVDRPPIAGDEVLIRVRAAGLDRGVWHQVTGRPRIVRLAFGLRTPRKAVPGRDVAGTVVAAGPAVTRFAEGDEVYGIGPGSFAEYAAAKESRIARRPANLTPEQAAVVPVSGMTALQALSDIGRVSHGKEVLVIGASGGVGSYAVQLAKSSGAHVTGVCSAAKLDLVRSLGADEVIDYAQGDFAGERRYDLIIDIAGNSAVSRLRRALTHGGTAVIVGGDNWAMSMDRQLRARVLAPFTGRRLTGFVTRERSGDLERLTGLIESGAVTPSVDRTYPLDQVPEAMRHLDAGKARGKIAIAVSA